MFKPRQSQVEILKYDHGKMGISAVPGSGKTHTLSYLAAQLILDGKIRNDQEILIVTLVNSAVDNFSTRIGDFIHQSNLLENVGYRVRTLHGLAHDIVRERPDLAGISDQFTIIDESESNRMVEMISSGYLREHPEMVDALVKPDINLSEDFRARSSWSELIPSMNQQFISLAKDLQLEPTDILEKVEKFGYSNMLVDMGVDVYTQYQRGLRYRNALDFSDLVRLALRVLTNDADFLARLRDRWPYILEDEAQDSSGIQEMILRLLSGEDGNWVRVGDPNQAIYETFTTANPKYLRNFLKEKGVTERSLPNSGRSSKKIIDLANFLIKWTKETPPHPGLRDALDTPFIQPTPPGDPQPNPDNLANAIYIQGKKLTPDQEIKTIVRNIKQWLPANLERTIAVLCPIGNYAEQVIDALITEDIEVVELLQTNLSTRKTARVLEKVLSALAEPSATKKYSQAFQEIYSHDDDSAEIKQELSDTANALSRLQNLEDFFYPRAGGEWRRVIGIVSLSETALDRLDQFRIWFINWHQAAALPIDQLLLSISQSLFSSPAELALCHKFALMLEFSAQLHPDYGLVDFSNELKEISSSARKFSGFSDTETRFDPDAHKGKVFVSTFHKAKGMEWDRVYLMSVNNYDFPSAQVFDSYKGEKWFIRENYNPPAELLSKLEALKTEDTRELFSEEGKATQDARVEYARERLRLLFVGITRARRSLVITWNTGKRGNMNMALPLEALHAWWQEDNETTD